MIIKGNKESRMDDKRMKSKKYVLNEFYSW